MDFIEDLITPAEQPAGDTSFIHSVAEGTDPVAFIDSDIPGFVHPLKKGKPDSTRYVAAEAAAEAQQSGIQPKAMDRRAALTLLSKADGIQNPSDKENELALKKRKNPPPAPQNVGASIDYPV